MRHWLWSITLLVGFTAFGLAPALGGGAKTIKIASSLPRTGSAKNQTDTIVNGIRMAIDEAGGKVGDSTVEYLDLDDATATAGEWTPEQEVANAQRAASDPAILVYIGPYNSGAAKNSMPILNRAGLLMISPACTAPGLTKPGAGSEGEPKIYRPTGKINFTRVVPTDDIQGPGGARWAKSMGVKKVYILDDNQVYGRGIATLFHETCDDLKIRVLGHESIDPRAQEFKSLMVKIANAKPDLLYYGGTTQTKGGQLAREMVEAGMKIPYMVPDGCMEKAFIESAGPANVNERCYVTFGGLPVEALLKGKGKTFVENYRKRFNSDPEAYSIYGYEAARVAMESLKRAGKADRQAVVNAALSLKDFNGSLGNWSFDANGDTTLATMSGNVVRNGDFQFVKLLEK